MIKKVISLLILIIISNSNLAQEDKIKKSAPWYRMVKYINLNSSKRLGFELTTSNILNPSDLSSFIDYLNFDLNYSHIIGDEKYLKHSIIKEVISNKSYSRNKYYYSFGYSFISMRIYNLTSRFVVRGNLGYEYQDYFYENEKDVSLFLKGLGGQFELEYALLTKLLLVLNINVNVDFYDTVYSTYNIGIGCRFLQ